MGEWLHMRVKGQRMSLVTEGEVMAQLQASPSEVNDLAASGRIATIRNPDGEWRFAPTGFARYKKAQKL